MKYIVNGTIRFVVDAETVEDAEQTAMDKMQDMLFTEFNLNYDQIKTEVVKSVDCN